jgi:hypothetical protein
LFPGVAGHVDVVWVEVCGNGGTRQAIDTTNVIDVAVCYEGSDRRQIVFGQQVTDRDGVGRSIYHQCGIALTRGDDIRVGFEVPERPGVDEKCHVVACFLDDESVRVVDAVDGPQACKNVFECLAV